MIQYGAKGLPTKRGTDECSRVIVLLWLTWNSLHSLVASWNWRCTPPGWARCPFLLFILSLDYFILCVGMFCLHECAPAVFPVLAELRRGCQTPGTRVINDCELSYGCWELNPDLLSHLSSSKTSIFWVSIASMVVGRVLALSCIWP